MPSASAPHTDLRKLPLWLLIAGVVSVAGVTAYRSLEPRPNTGIPSTEQQLALANEALLNWHSLDAEANRGVNRFCGNTLIDSFCRDGAASLSAWLKRHFPSSPRAEAIEETLDEASRN